MAVSVAPTPDEPLAYVTADNAAAVANTQDAFTSSPEDVASTYALVAASCEAVGSERLIIFDESTSTSPLP